MAQLSEMGLLHSNKARVRNNNAYIELIPILIGVNTILMILIMGAADVEIQ